MNLFIPPLDSFTLTTFSETFTISRNGLIINGVYPSPPRALCSLWLIINVILQSGALQLTINTSMIDIEKRDFIDATRQLSILFLFCNILIKMSVLKYHRKIIESIILRVDLDYKYANLHFKGDKMRVVKEHAIAGLWLQNLWALLVGFVGNVFPVSAVIMSTISAVQENVYTRRMVFLCVLPWFDEYKYESPFYEVVFIYEMFLSTWSALLYIGFDPLVPIFSLHMCGQLELVKQALRKVFEDGLPKEVVRQRLSKVVQDLQKIYRFADDINYVFSFVYECIFSSTPLLSTAAAFQIFSCLRAGIIPYEFTFFFIATVFHIFIPSYYGDLMMEKSTSVCEAVYNSNWEKIHDKSARATLLVLMLRAQRPLQLTTMLKPVSLLLFSEVAQQSWTMFNLLLAVFK